MGACLAFLSLPARLESSESRVAYLEGRVAFQEQRQLLILEEFEEVHVTLYEHDAQLSQPGQVRGFSAIELHRLGILERFEWA